MRYRVINRKKAIVLAVGEILGFVLWFPSNIFRRREKIRPENIRNILVIRTAYLGDVIMTLPVLKPLKDRYPFAEIDFLTNSPAKELLKNNPHVKEVLTYDPFWFYPTPWRKALKDYLGFLKIIRNKHYDLAIEIRGDIRDIFLLLYAARSRYKVSYGVGGGSYLLTHAVPYPGVKHRVEYHLDLVRYLDGKSHGVDWGFYLTGTEERELEEILGGKGVSPKRPLVVIHPGARKELKCWPPERFAVVADTLAERLNVSVALTGSPDELRLVEKVGSMMKHRPVIFAGGITLRQFAALLKRCVLFIGNDSAPLHIASVLRTPTVAIFGPSKSRETGPYGNKHRVVEKIFPCRYRCDEDKCRFRKYNQCLQAITSEDVIKAAVSLWKGTNEGADSHS